MTKIDSRKKDYNAKQVVGGATTSAEIKSQMDRKVLTAAVAAEVMEKEVVSVLTSEVNERKWLSSIERILTEMELPVDILQRASAPMLKVKERWYDDNSCPRGMYTYRWIHNGTRTEISSEELESPNRTFGGGGIRTAIIEGATFAVRIDSNRHLNGARWSKPHNVVVWDKCDPTALANAIAPIVWGEGADAQYIDALKSFGAAKQWVASHFTITPHAEKDDRIVVNRQDFLLDYSYVRNPQVLDRLVRKHGIGLIQEHLSDEQQAFIRAKEDVAEAAQYVLARYRVLALGKGQHVKFALRFSPGKLGDIDSVYLNSEEEQPLQTLLQKHETLRAALFTQTTDRTLEVHPYYKADSYHLKDGVWWGESSLPQDDRRGGVNTGSFEYLYPLGNELDMVNVKLDYEGEFSKNLLRLSGERQQGATPMGGFRDALSEGEECFVDSYKVLLPLKVGETKNFVFRIAQDWTLSDTGSSVWGVTATRTPNGVEFKSYDNGTSYTCTGYWGSKVSVN